MTVQPMQLTSHTKLSLIAQFLDAQRGEVNALPAHARQGRRAKLEQLKQYTIDIKLALKD